jgi:uroporphyrinogen decarboxylase
LAWYIATGAHPTEEVRIFFVLHRERVLKTLNHQEPDRVPLDLGATRGTSISVEAYARLVDWLGLSQEVELVEQGDRRARRMTRLAQVDERILERLEVDLRGLILGAPDNWQDVDITDRSYKDQWGVERTQPPGSPYYEITHSPLAGETTMANISHYPWPDAADPGLVHGLRQQAQKLRHTTDYAVALHLGDVFVHQSQFMCGSEQWYIDCAAAPERLGALMDAILEYRLEVARRALQEVGDLIDVVQVADDLGDSRGLIVSPSMFRRIIKPRLAHFLAQVHSLTLAKVLFHSCGSIGVILPDLIEIGVDAINPVQLTAAGMDPARLKQAFGDRLCFWGAVDSQSILPGGSPKQVEEEVSKCIHHLGRGGGYILCAVHNIQPDVPPENIWTMYQSALQSGHYPLVQQTNRYII